MRLPQQRFCLVIAVACCKGQLVIGIEIHRVQRCESGGTGANLVNAAAKIVNTMIEFIKMFSEFGMLSIILCLTGDIINRQSAYFFIGVAVFYYQSSGSGCLSLSISVSCASFSWPSSLTSSPFLTLRVILPSAPMLPPLTNLSFASMV